MTYHKKLIEVSLPLDAINKESAREKSIRHGHPSTLHLWWARRPLATCRAVLFSSLIDDPSEHRELFPTEPEQDAERTRLFKLIEEMVKWENANDEKFMELVRAEVRKATGDNPPPVLDPFAGGGSIPLEAQRLGLEANASDLNPVAVLINKALIEIPPKFAGLPPVNPEAKKTLMQQDWCGAQGLADDIRYYGKWMRDEAEKRIGHLYPKVKLPKEYGKGEATAIAWIWARTMKCPNPACGAEMPLITSFWLSKKKGKETWIEPIINHSTQPPTITFTIKNGSGKPIDPPKVGRGAQFKCLCCENVATEQYVKEKAKEGQMGAKLMSIVTEGKKGRVYLASTNEQENATPTHLVQGPTQSLAIDPRNIWCVGYGLDTFDKLFTPRQLTALTTFSDLLPLVRDHILSEAENNGKFTQDISLKVNIDVSDYAKAILTYLAIVVDRCSDYWSAVCSWHSGRDIIRNTFARQALPMVWDFAETNPFSDSTGNFLGALDWVAKVVENSCNTTSGHATQRNATTAIEDISNPLISTDPPYYDNIGYADLSDFFYVWLRRSLNTIYPELFETVLVPKSQELIATPYRFGGSRQKAQEFFEQGLSQAFERMRAVHHPDYPLTVYYAFKQAEADMLDESVEQQSNGKKPKTVASTGWETMLEGLIRTGFTITGTWPMRTEMANRSVGHGTNALASSIVLVCRPRPIDAPIASRRQFINELRAELADALKKMQHGTIAPVDLAQASIGPGMAVYSRYSKVIESDGSPLSIRTALQLINRELDSVLAEQEGEYDVETRWAVAWFEEYAMNEGQYGRAEVLSKAKNASIQVMVDAGVLEAKAGKVRLLKRDELSEKWQPETNLHLTAWEVMQRMIHALDRQGGQGGGNVLAQVPQYAEVVRDLAYRLYNICERKGWSQEALYYNMLITSWTDIDDQARSVVHQPKQAALSFEG
jgi:putative DNA methylase